MKKDKQTHMMRNYVWSSLLTLTLAVGSSVAYAGQSELLKATLVIVNGKRITQDNLNDMGEFMLLRQHKGTTGIRLTQAEERELADTALRELIRMRLIFDEATTLQLSVSDEEIQTQLERLSVPADLKPEVARRYAEAELYIDRILAALGYPPHRPSPTSIRRYWVKEKDTTFRTNSFVRVRHIILPTVGNENPEVMKAKADLFRQKVMDKPKAERTQFFSELAREFSDGKFSSGGGLLRLGRDKDGWFQQNFGNKRPDGKPIFPEPLYKGIQSLTKNDLLSVSDVIRSTMGFHLLFLEELRGGEQIAWKEAQKMIRLYLEQQERKRRIMKWLREKIAQSKIVWHDGDAYPADLILPPEMGTPRQ